MKKLNTVKEYMTIKELVNRWYYNLSHEYDVTQINKMIRSNKVKTSILLEDCYLFPISSDEEDFYGYLNTVSYTRFEGDTKIIGLVKSRQQAIDFLEKISEDFSKPASRETPGALNAIKVHEHDLINECNSYECVRISDFGQPDNKKNMVGIMTKKNKDNPIIYLDIPTPVYPWIWDSLRLQEQFISLEQTGFLTEIKAIDKEHAYESDKLLLERCAIVKLKGIFYFVVQKKNIDFKWDKSFVIFQLSNKVFETYLQNDKVIVTYESIISAESALLPPLNNIKIINDYYHLLNLIHEKNVFDVEIISVSQSSLKEWISRNTDHKHKAAAFLAEMISFRFGIRSFRGKRIPIDADSHQQPLIQVFETLVEKFKQNESFLKKIYKKYVFMAFMDEDKEFFSKYISTDDTKEILGRMLVDYFGSAS